MPNDLLCNAADEAKAEIAEFEKLPREPVFDESFPGNDDDKDPAFYEFSSETRDLVNLVGLRLEKYCQYNKSDSELKSLDIVDLAKKNFKLTDEDALKLEKETNISLLEYLHKIFTKFPKFDNLHLVSMLIYLKRLEDSKIYLIPKSAHLLLLLTCLMVAQAEIDGDHQKHVKIAAELIGITPKELRKFQWLLLEKLEWELSIKPDERTKVWESLLNLKKDYENLPSYSFDRQVLSITTKPKPVEGDELDSAEQLIAYSPISPYQEEDHSPENKKSAGEGFNVPKGYHDIRLFSPLESPTTNLSSYNFENEVTFDDKGPLFT